MTSRKASSQNNSHPSQRKSRLHVTEQERQRMIAEAAYYNAEHRGFMRGDPEQDWFLAVAQIERQLHSNTRID